MGKRVKPVKAWGLLSDSGTINPETSAEKETADFRVSIREPGYRAAPVIVSLSDPRANRISAAERRVIKAAVVAAKHCRKHGTVTLDELMAAVDKLERAKGGANG